MVFKEKGIYKFSIHDEFDWGMGLIWQANRTTVRLLCRFRAFIDKKNINQTFISFFIDTMQELETLLTSLIKRGRKPWGLKYFAEVMVFKTYIDFITKKWASSPTSLRELVSLESGLWQFVCDRSLLKSIWKSRAKEPSMSALGFKSEVLALSFEPEYRLLESALVPEEELGQFLVENIKVEWK